MNSESIMWKRVDVAHLLRELIIVVMAFTGEMRRTDGESRPP